MRKKTMLIVLMSLLFIFGCSANTSPSEEATASGQSQVVEDLYGRSVELPAEVDSYLAVGTGALRLVAYLDGLEGLAGVEEADWDFQNDPRRDYAYVYHEELKGLPSIGQGGKGSTYAVNPEEIIKLQPDLIFSAYEADGVEQLEKETGIPVIAVRTSSQGIANEEFIQALDLVGQVIGQKERADELKRYIQEIKADLHQRTADLAEADQPTVYSGAVTYKGANAFEGTYSQFGPFQAIQTPSIADREEEGFYEIDLETILAADPDYIFLDPGNAALYEEQIQTHPDYFNQLTAFKADQLYSMPAYNNYSTNQTYALIDSYHAGRVLYPDAFRDLDFYDQANQILEKFLGQSYVEQMEEAGLVFGPLDGSEAVGKD